MHAKYEVSTSYCSKVIAKVKVDNRQTDRQTNKQTGQKQYAPDHSIRGGGGIKINQSSKDSTSPMSETCKIWTGQVKFKDLKLSNVNFRNIGQNKPEFFF